MDRIRINRRDLSLRARQRAERAAVTDAPLIHVVTPAGDADDELLDRIDALLLEVGAPTVDR